MSAKARTIKAWAVVDSCGKRCDNTDELFYDNRPQARFAAADTDCPCGPHTVVPLTGTWVPPKGKR